MIAEESTAWPKDDRCGPEDGGLGFDYEVEHGLDE